MQRSVYYITYHKRVIDAPMSESQPDVVNPHPQLSQSQTHNLKRYERLATREKERREEEKEGEGEREKKRKRERRRKSEREREREESEREKKRKRES